MATRALNREESLGLMLALLGHGALVAWLMLYRPAVTLPPPPGRMEVTISDEAGPVSTSPEPQAAPAPDKGPVLGEAMPPLVPEPQPVVKPEPAPPRAAPAPALVKPAPPKPAPPKAATKPAQVPPKAPPRVTSKPGASAFDRDFGAGIPAVAPGKSKNPPAAAASAQQKSSWVSLIGSKIRGPWNNCSVNGLEVEKLRGTVRVTLAINGSILSMDAPVVTGQTPANQAQVAPFKACMVRAIKLAAPFTGLPPEFYNDWKIRNPAFRKE